MLKKNSIVSRVVNGVAQAHLILEIGSKGTVTYNLSTQRVNRFSAGPSLQYRKRKASPARQTKPTIVVASAPAEPATTTEQLSVTDTVSEIMGQIFS